MAPTITGISSMATRQVLNELADRCANHTIAIEATGGVDAAKRVKAGEAFDLVILADNVIRELEGEGHVLAGSRVAFVRSSMAVAIREGAPRPDIGDGAALQAALMGARSVGYSTGPSGLHLLAVLKSWGLDAAADPKRFVQAKPGISVASLVASGEAEIGIQQMSELLGEPGIDILGFVPPPVQSVTTFSIGIGARSPHVEEARAVIAYLNAAEAVETKRHAGMEPA
ncbi:MAG TPA: substrate-binding domain-containing protein [Stellaceae bacterium]|nr:substrate-binding domain-containing protein [Stellaceae bacterium]